MSSSGLQRNFDLGATSFQRPRGFFKVLNGRATAFDTRAKNCQGPRGRGIWGHAPPEKFEIL